MLLAGDLGGPRAVPIHHVPDAMSRSWKFDLCEVASELVVCKKPGLCSVTRSSHTAQAAWPWTTAVGKALLKQKPQCGKRKGWKYAPVTWNCFLAFCRDAFWRKQPEKVLCGSPGLLDESGLRTPACRAQGIDGRGWSLSDSAASSTCLVNHRTLLKEEVILKRVQTL